MTLMDRINGLLGERGWTGRQLAKRAGLPPSTVARWCRGETSPRAEGIEALARAFGVPPAELAGGTDEFSADERLLIRLVRALELSYEEAARRLGTPPPARYDAVIREEP